MPAVLESAVIGPPHPGLGEALAVREAGATLDAATILGAAAPKLARFKPPRLALFADALSRNAMGEAPKAALARAHAGAFAKG